MPRPGYLICSAFGALDQYTNAIVASGIVESVQIQKFQLQDNVVVYIEEGGLAGRPISMRVVATWLKEEGDAPENTFQSQLIARFPGLEEEVLLAEFVSPPFSFTAAVHRLIVPEVNLPAYLSPGILLIESRLRRVGTTEWTWKQSFPIVLEEAPSPPPPVGQPPATSDGGPR